MNKRVIKAVLTKKFNEWVASIKDEKVKELVKNSSIITGGAITSLLQGQDVNDFDIYFTNFDTTYQVSRYYIKQFNVLHEGKDTPKPEVYVDETDINNLRVRIKIKSAGIAGENTPDSQYQYFEGRPLEEGEAYVQQVVGNILTEADGMDGTKLNDDKSKGKYRPVFVSDNAITLSDKIQLVIRFYGNADEIHKNYDFAHCTSYWTSIDKELVLRPQALEAILAKELRYIGSLYPVCSFIRTRKFIKAGWHINAGQMLKICFQISELDLTDIKTLEDQLTGVDTAYFIQVINYLKEQQAIDPSLKIDSAYLVSIIDKIF